MIVKFLKASADFRGVFYNMDKVGNGKAELMAAVNFDTLNGLNEIKPTDYLNYLQAISSNNKAIGKPQLHVAISANRRDHDKHALTDVAERWLEKMGYAKQPYFIVFHKDTENNHVHIVSSRVDHDGRKISSGFERVRAVRAMNEIIGHDEHRSWRHDLEKAKAYRVSTLPQFRLLLECTGYKISGNALIKYGKKLATLDFDTVKLNGPDQRRAAQLIVIFNKYAPQHDLASFTAFMKTKMGIELILHAKDGKPAYGYTIIDHAQKNAYKGSEIMPLKQLMLLLGSPDAMQQTPSPVNQPKQTPNNSTASNFSVNISKDVDDDQIYGPRRRRKKKARTNTR
ncbi:relaxase/mobilization nuclease domain-containing protein [Mucilaginibacter phyllosphaerae]